MTTSNPTPYFDSPEKAALADALSAFPLHSARVLETNSSSSRAIVLLEVELSGSSHLHQVAALRFDDDWLAWSSGPAPGWLDLDDPFGALTRLDKVEAGTTSVTVDFFGSRVVHPVRGDWLMRTTWDLTSQDDEVVWSIPIFVEIAGESFDVVNRNIIVRRGFFIEELLRFESSNFIEAGWINDAIDQLIDDDPRLAWSLLDEAISSTTSEDTAAMIAAGPLESLLSSNLEILIDQVEASAHESKKMRNALLGVWIDPSDAALSVRWASISGN